MKKKKSSSILKKFLLFNFFVFTVLGLFTILYLQAIQPNLVKERTKNHSLIIKNTSDHLNRLNISLDKKNIKTFLLSTRFLFQSLDRVRFYNSEGQIIGDTNILDLDQDVFSRTDTIILKSLGNNDPGEENEINKNLEKEKSIQENDISKIIIRDYLGEPIVLQNKINNNFFVREQFLQ